MIRGALWVLCAWCGIAQGNDAVSDSATDRAPLEIPDSPAPAAATDFAADRDYSPTAMVEARKALRTEHGGTQLSTIMFRRAEYRDDGRQASQYWDALAWFGGDIHRVMFKSEGERLNGEGVEKAEVQALYSRAVGVYTDVQLGLRQDLELAHSTYLSAGFESVLPYWLDVGGSLFLSTKRRVLARLEGSYEARITNRWILQPHTELNLSTQSDSTMQTGSGLTESQLGLRLRYELRREFAPYLGLVWERQYGRTASFARARGEDPDRMSFVLGVRAFY